MNICIQSLKVWRKFVLPWLKHRIFARGLFFIGAPCTDPSLAHKALSYEEKIAKIDPVNPEIFDEIRRTTT